MLRCSVRLSGFLEIQKKSNEEGKRDSRYKWEGDKTEHLEHFLSAVSTTINETGGKAFASFGRKDLVDVLIDGDEQTKKRQANTIMRKMYGVSQSICHDSHECYWVESDALKPAERAWYKKKDFRIE